MRGGYPPSTEPKLCPKCKEIKPASDFRPDAANRSGLSSYCRKCTNALDRRRYADRRQWWHEGTEKRLRKYRLKRQFGLTLDEYDAIFVAQGGVCAICGEAETASSRRWHDRVQALSVDHDHITGAIRGLLCDRCNRVLGWARDNPELLIKAAAYLRQLREVPIEAS